MILVNSRKGLMTQVTQDSWRDQRLYPHAIDRCTGFGRCRRFRGSEKFADGIFWESERYRKGLGYTGTRRRAGFPGQPVILPVPHPEDSGFFEIYPTRNR